MISFMISYALPFLFIAVLLLGWAFISYRLRGRFPRYYKWCIRVYDSLPIVTAALIVLFFMYFYLTSPY